MGDWISIIEYREFYDIPRIFIVRYSNMLFLFDCPFNDSIDDYEECYRVYQMPKNITQDNLPDDWRVWPPAGAKFIKAIAVSDISFDETRRKSIMSDVLI